LEAFLEARGDSKSKMGWRYNFSFFFKNRKSSKLIGVKTSTKSL
jgi:hypothetical protein